MTTMPDDRPLDGWLVIDKPQRLSSNRVVEGVRRLIGTKVGHVGTLDPLATGVLPLALGEATKTVSYAMDGRKCYRFRIRWGIARATDDCEGENLAALIDLAGDEEFENSVTIVFAASCHWAIEKHCGEGFE